jgi:RNA polymerase sigma-70 factor, ECF subfamily
MTRTGTGAQAPEDPIRTLCEAGRHDEATTAALRAYGDEVFRFLCASLKSEANASDAFSLFAEDLWKGLPKFAWECSLRTWSYTLARRAGARTMRKGWNRKAVLGSTGLADAVAEVRTQTLAWLRTETKTKMRALRDKLDEADQALLMLRIDRGLAWDELARVFVETESEDSELDPEALKREAARLRKRFQTVKDRLKELAKSEGLYGDD